MTVRRIDDEIRRHFIGWSYMEDKTQRLLLEYQMFCPFDVARHTRKQLENCWGIGEKRLHQIEMMLAYCNLTFAPYEDSYDLPPYPGDC
jgi:hypothetical protein